MGFQRKGAKGNAPDRVGGLLPPPLTPPDVPITASGGFYRVNSDYTHLQVPEPQ